MGSEYEKLVAIILSEAEDLQEPFTTEEIIKTLKCIVGKGVGQIPSALDQLCMIGLITRRGDRWLHTKYLQDDRETTAGSLHLENIPVVAQDTTSASSSGGLVKTTCYESSIVSYDCDSLVLEENKHKLKRIIEVVRSSATALRGADIAIRSELGKAKSDVNRYLYFFEKKGVLIRSENKFWKLQRSITEPEFDVYAAELAKMAPSKKQKSRSGQSNTCEYGCEKPSGNCYHIKQENHYHQHILQVGDGSKLEFHTHGGQQNRGHQN